MVATPARDWKMASMCGPLTSNEPELQVDTRLWPQPMEDRMFLEIDEPVATVSLKVFDIQGREVPISVQKQGNRFELTRGSMNPGIYVYVLDGGINNIRARGKFWVK